jgi:hypothetical protein
MKGFLSFLAAAALLIASPSYAQTQVLIDFESTPGPDGVLGTADDVPLTAPSLFSSQTTQLTTEFASTGVTFTMPTTNDANEVLLAQSFSPPGTHSPVNLLAAGSGLVLGGTFQVPVFEVSALVGITGNGASGADILEIFDSNDFSLGTAQGSDITVTISSVVPIARFEIRDSGAISDVVAIDNFSFVTQPPGPVLSVVGACPGANNIQIDGANPFATVILLYGPAGSFTLPGGPCAGTTLDLATPNIAGLFAADLGGSVTLSTMIPAGFCGTSLQAVEPGTCLSSNLVLL